MRRKATRKLIITEPELYMILAVVIMIGMWLWIA